MSLISVGIHENLSLGSETKINEKGTLELTIEVKQNNATALEALSGNETVQSMKSSIRFYPPNILNFDKDAKTSAELAQDLSILRYQFMAYARLFATEEEVIAALGGLKMFEDIGVAKEDYDKAFAALVKEEFLKKVTTNLSTKFYNFLVSKDAFSGKVKFRQKFLRQSKAKNFATVSRSSFDTWIESMVIPKEQSQIIYTEYEITKGKNLAHPASSSAPQTNAEDVAKAASLFDAPAPDAPVADNKPSLFS